VRKSGNILIEKIRRSDVSGAGKDLFNTFENVVSGEHPFVRRIKQELLRAGSLGASMTGSGPTVFALARDASSARHICRQVSHLADFCIVTNTSDVSIAKM